MKLKLWLGKLKQIRVKIRATSPPSFPIGQCLPRPRRFSSSSSSASASCYSVKLPSPRHSFSVDCGCSRRSRKKKVEARKNETSSSKRRHPAEADLRRLSRTSSTAPGQKSGRAPLAVAAKEEMPPPKCVKEGGRKRESMALQECFEAGRELHVSIDARRRRSLDGIRCLSEGELLRPKRSVPITQKAWFQQDLAMSLPSANDFHLHRSSSSSSSSASLKHVNNSGKENSSSRTSDQDSFFTSFEKGRTSDSSNSSSEILAGSMQINNNPATCSDSSTSTPTMMMTIKTKKKKKTVEAMEALKDLMKKEDEIVHAKLLIRSYSSRRMNKPEGSTRSVCSSASSFSRAFRQACAIEADTGGVLYPWLCDDDRAESIVDLESTMKPWEDKQQHHHHRRRHRHCGSGSSRQSTRRRSRRRMMLQELSSTGYSSPTSITYTTTPRSLVSSVISSSASSYRRLRTSRKAPANHYRQYYLSPPASSIGSPIRLEHHHHQRVGDSVAIVKRSRDPYLDFRDSMVDMILEKQIYSCSDLEELLHCFLSLNSTQHHDTIVQAFTEVWEAVFGNTNAGRGSPSPRLPSSSSSSIK